MAPEKWQGLVSLKVLRAQAGWSLAERAEYFNQQHGTRLNRWDLSSIFAGKKVSMQKLKAYPGPPEPQPFAFQMERLMIVKEQVRALKREGAHMVQMDECVFSSRRYDLYTWAPVGKPLPVKHRWGGGNYISVMAGISEQDGYVHGIYKEGNAMIGADCVGFVQSLRNFYPEGKIGVLVDNCRIHRTTAVKEICQRLNVVFIFNCPYRPDLNGIEVFWRSAKHIYRKTILNHRAKGEPWDQLSTAVAAVDHVTDEKAKAFAEEGWNAIEHSKPMNTTEHPVMLRASI
jgi:hypothetical protein